MLAGEEQISFFKVIKSWKIQVYAQIIITGGLRLWVQQQQLY